MILPKFSLAMPHDVNEGVGSCLKKKLEANRLKKSET
jgi:hypothetical protein